MHQIYGKRRGCRFIYRGGLGFESISCFILLAFATTHRHCSYGDGHSHEAPPRSLLCRPLSGVALCRFHAYACRATYICFHFTSYSSSRHRMGSPRVWESCAFVTLGSSCF